AGLGGPGLTPLCDTPTKIGQPAAHVVRCAGDLRTALVRLLLSRPRDEVRPGHPARQAGGGDAPRGRLPDPLGLPDQLVVGRAAPGGRFGPLGAGGTLRLLLRGGRSRGVALLLLLAAATAEPVGLQRVVQRGTAVAGTGRRGQGLRLAPDRPLLRGRRTRGA